MPSKYYKSRVGQALGTKPSEKGYTCRHADHFNPHQQVKLKVAPQKRDGKGTPMWEAICNKNTWEAICNKYTEADGLAWDDEYKEHLLQLLDGVRQTNTIRAKLLLTRQRAVGCCLCALSQHLPGRLHQRMLAMCMRTCRNLRLTKSSIWTATPPTRT